MTLDLTRISIASPLKTSKGSDFPSGRTVVTIVMMLYPAPKGIIDWPFTVQVFNIHKNWLHFWNLSFLNYLFSYFLPITAFILRLLWSSGFSTAWDIRFSHTIQGELMRIKSPLLCVMEFLWNKLAYALYGLPFHESKFWPSTVLNDSVEFVTWCLI